MTRLTIILAALIGCEDPTFNDTDNSELQRQQNLDVSCYTLTDNSADLTLLNPNDVEVRHYTNTDMGPQGDALNILFIFTNHSGTPIVDNPASSVEFDMAAFGDTFFDSPNGARAFFEESSYGNLSFTGTALGWMDFADSTTSNLSVNGGGFLSLAEQYVNLDDYDMLALASTYPGQLISGSGVQIDCVDLGGRQLEYKGLTYFHRPRAVDADPTINTSGIYAVLPDSIYAHEITHALGVGGHALSLDCGTNSYDSTCDIVPYGNPFDIQGDRVFSAHSSAYHKYLMGWIDDKELPIVTASDTYTIHPLEEPRGKIYGLEIPLESPLVLDNGVEYDRIYVDYRTPVGFDDHITDVADYHYVWDLDAYLDTDGIYLKLGYANGSHSTVLLNAHPGDPYDELGYSPHGTPGNTGRNAHAMLNIGETFILPNGAGTITVLGHDDIHMPGNLGYPNNVLQGMEIEVVLN